jgi:hypothetical protein
VGVGHEPGSGRRQAPRTSGTAGPSITIGAKISAVVGGLLVVLVVSNLLLLQQLSSTSSTYDRLLANEVAQAEVSRDMQVEFKKQVQEWKNILLRGSDPADRATYTKSFRAEYTTVRTLADTLVGQVRDPQARAGLVTFREQHEALQRNYELALTAFVRTNGRDFRTADTFVRGQDRPPTDLLDAVVGRLQAVVDARVEQQNAAVAARERLLLLLGGLGVVVLLLVLVAVVVRIVRPIRALTAAARTAAGQGMPAAVASIAAMDGWDEPPALEPFVAGTRDELAGLAAALTTMQEAAVGLALEQHRRERENAEMLLNLGRRNQALLARVLSYITELERVEQDPDVMAALFRIDHATTRVRRNAASMLVLAGAQPSPGRAESVPVADVVRAALSEIEDYLRVDLYHLEDASVRGAAAADLTHLLAELLENATSFSPPASRVSVVGQQVGEGYRIRVIDQGLGMTRDELDAANQRIVRAVDGPSDARLLGLYVVGRLAVRNDISVRLEASAGHGITASVVVPPESVVGAHAVHPVVVGAAPSQDPWRSWPTQASVPAAVPAAATAAVPAQLAGPAPAAPAPWPVPAGPPVVVDLRDPRFDGSTTVAGETVQPAPGVPVRVRGRSLARAGFPEGDADERALLFAEPTLASSDRLRAFQVDVEAARREVGLDLVHGGLSVDPPPAR